MKRLYIRVLAVALSWSSIIAMTLVTSLPEAAATNYLISTMTEVITLLEAVATMSTMMMITKLKADLNHIGMSPTIFTAVRTTFMPEIRLGKPGRLSRGKLVVLHFHVFFNACLCCDLLPALA